MHTLLKQVHSSGLGGIELSPEGFARLFPFHFATDAGLVLTQTGPSLQRLATDLYPGASLGDIIEFVRPAGSATPEQLAKVQGSLVVLRHRSTGVVLRGQFLATSGMAGWVYLGSPWFVNSDALEASGLSLEDFPPHDSVAELLLFGQTQQMAMGDLRLLNERLERKRRQVEETEALYRAAISAANAVPYREDYLRDVFVYVGEGFPKLTGLEAGSIRPSELRSLDVGAVVASTDTTLRVAGGEVLRRRREYRYLAPDGQERWFSDASVVFMSPAGVPTGAIGMLQDVTQRRQAEEQVRQLATVAANTASAVAITNERREFIWVNDAFARLIGYGLEEIRGGCCATLRSGRPPTCRRSTGPRRRWRLAGVPRRVPPAATRWCSRLGRRRHPAGPRCARRDHRLHRRRCRHLPDQGLRAAAGAAERGTARDPERDSGRRRRIHGRRAVRLLQFRVRGPRRVRGQGSRPPRRGRCR